MIKYESNFLSKDIANKIYEYAKNNDDKFTEFGNGEKEFTVHTYHSIEKIDPNILSLLQDSAMSVYNYVKNNYGSNLIDFDPFKTHIARFEKGNGMHEHFDSSRPKDIATLVYINDDYEGGEIYFPYHNIYIKPNIGDLLCFPDNPDFIHGVKPITNGIRYTTPRWFTRLI
jgi:hypothetical protein